MLRAVASWQTTVQRAEKAAIDAARRLPIAVFTNFFNPKDRKQYEDELAKLRPEGSPEEIDRHIQTVALLVAVPSEIHLRLGNYFRYRSHSAPTEESKMDDLWSAIRRYSAAIEQAQRERGAAARQNYGQASHGIAICFGLMGKMRTHEAVMHAKRAVDCLTQELTDAAPALNTYGANLLKLGRYDEARTALEESVARRPGAIVPNYNLACAYARLGDGHETRLRKESYYQRTIETLLKLKGTIGSDMRTIDKWATDDDLKGIREDPALGRVFANTIKELKAAG
jgi:tetratricopeptide (TPR) repeat protein